MSKKLLLADDSITIQKVIQITFAHEDYQLTITDNGDTALVRAEELVPDLVLADVYMPGKNGYELCAAIKQSPALRHVPVLLLAGSFEPFDEGKARAAGADAWIEKPFESQALIDKVAELLSAAPATAATAAPLAAAAEPETAAAPVEPFADFAFEEPATAATGPEEFVFEEPATAAIGPEEFVFEETATAATGPEEFVFEELAAAEPNFEFIDEPFPAEMAQPAAFEAAPAAAPAFSGLAAGEEILPLGDDDILGAEDLEPLAEISTLTPWSREEALAEEPFPAFTELELPPVVPAEQPFTVATPLADRAAEPVVEPAVASAAAPHLEAATARVAEPLPEPAAEPAPVATGQGATMLSAEELELIVERAVARALEKLAGTVLERVAWEVVPDLAEALIKEEIRQIKEAAV